MNSHFIYVEATKSASGERGSVTVCSAFGVSLLNCGQSGNEMGFCAQPHSHCTSTCIFHITN